MNKQTALYRNQIDQAVLTALATTSLPHPPKSERTANNFPATRYNF